MRARGLAASRDRTTVAAPKKIVPIVACPLGKLWVASVASGVQRSGRPRRTRRFSSGLQIEPKSIAPPRNFAEGPRCRRMSAPDRRIAAGIRKRWLPRNVIA
jgi:hypothetical protein